MSNVFTFFCHGTAFNRLKDDEELVSKLSHLCQGVEAQISIQNDTPILNTLDADYLILEGPGSDEGREQGVLTPGTANPLLGIAKGRETQNLFGYEKKGTANFGLTSIYSDFQKDFMGDTEYNGKNAGLILGRGWRDNVYKATLILANLQERGIDTVNLVGWSRGAVTCLMIANKIYEVFADKITVNIFAVDPVIGGPTSTYPEMFVVPANVANYLAIMATDDCRRTFHPTDINILKVLSPKASESFSKRPNIHFLPMPGNHSDVVNVGVTQDLQCGADIIRYLAQKFLVNHGTLLNADGSNYSKQDLLKGYEYLKENEEKLGSRAKSNDVINLIPGVESTRKIRHERSKYVIDSQYFVNEHHRLLATFDGLLVNTISALTWDNQVAILLKHHDSLAPKPGTIIDSYQSPLTHLGIF